MKNLIKVIGLIGLITIFLASCTKDELPVDQNGDVQISAAKGATSVGGVTPIGGPVLSGPDLVITDISTDMPFVTSSACGGTAQQPNFNDTYTIKVQVKNIGNMSVTNSYKLLIAKISGFPLNDSMLSPTSSLAPGAIHTFVFSSVQLLSGPVVPITSQEILSFVDHTFLVTETNEGNNRGSYEYCGE